MNRRQKTILFTVSVLVTLGANALMMSPLLGQGLLLRYGDGTGMLDLLPYYTGARAASALASLGAQGTAIYTRILFVDFVFIVGTAVVFSMIISFLCKRAGLGGRWPTLRFAAYARSLFDTAENLLILSALHLVPGNQALLAAAGVITLLKWVCMALTVISIIILLFAGLRRRKNR